jgi:hypothetical protein
VAIAPAEVISRDMCRDAFNYASKNDIVHYGHPLHVYYRADAMFGNSEQEKIEYLMKESNIYNQLILLEPHEGAKGLDHELQSPTFIPKIVEHNDIMGVQNR